MFQALAPTPQEFLQVSWPNVLNDVAQGLRKGLKE